jgi:hypothetical protein
MNKANIIIKRALNTKSAKISKNSTDDPDMIDLKYKTVERLPFNKKGIKT